MEVAAMIEPRPNAGSPMPNADKFTAIALLCGPPTDAFRWDAHKSKDFISMAAELFGIREPKHVIGLYALYEKWYAGENLDRMLTERQTEKETTST